MLIWEAAAVAEAAIEEGVAGVSADEFSLTHYREELEARLGESYSVMRQMINQVKGKGKRIVFPEGDKEPVLRAAASTRRAEHLSPHSSGAHRSY